MILNEDLFEPIINEGWENINGLKLTKTGVHGEKLDDYWIDYKGYLINKNRLQDEMLRDFKEENGYTRADEDKDEFWVEFDNFITERGLEYLDKTVNESLDEDLFLAPQEPSDETPATPEASGVAKLILDAINDESDTIKMYNDLLANTDNEDIIKIIQDITAEENNHLGMLQKALEIVSPNASNIEDGVEEANSIVDDEQAIADSEVILVAESLNEANKAKSWVIFFDEDGNNPVGSDGSKPISVMPAQADKIIQSGNYLIPKWAKSYVIITQSQFEMMSYDSLQKYRKKYAKPVNESLNEDIHDKFKKDIKNDYKAWASKQEKQEAKRKEFLSMLDEIENVTPEQRERMEKAANDLFPDEEFKYKFPHNIEKEDFPFYVTYYAEYPIYEPAEGGYYYAGRDAIWSEGFNTKEDAVDYAKKYTSEDSDTWEELTDGFICRGKYIGEDQYVRIEDNKSYLSDTKGYEPYQ